MVRKSGKLKRVLKNSTECDRKRKGNLVYQFSLLLSYELIKMENVKNKKTSLYFKPLLV